MPVTFTPVFGEERSRSLKKLLFYLIVFAIGIFALGIFIAVQKIRAWTCIECPDHSEEVSIWKIATPLAVIFIARFWAKYTSQQRTLRALLRHTGAPEGISNHDVPFYIDEGPDQPVPLEEANDFLRQENEEKNRQFKEMEEWQSEQMRMRAEIARLQRQIASQQGGNVYQPGRRIGFTQGHHAVGRTGRPRRAITRPLVSMFRRR